MLEIAEAKLSDIAVIQSIARKTWPHTFETILSSEQMEYMLEMMYSEDSLRNQMLVSSHNFILAKMENETLGFLSYELNYKKRGQTKLHKLYLLPDKQGKGIGYALMKAVEEIALDKKQNTITLNVNRFNKAFQFYQKMGYVFVTNEDIDIGNGYLMEDSVLELTLKEIPNS